jgi:CRISPR-associated protein Cas2
MYMLVTYDVSTADKAGEKRLRTVAKICKDYGQRVQKSVFEMKLDPSEWTTCAAKLQAAIDPATDSLRFYHLGNSWAQRIEHIGVRNDFNIDGYLEI